MTDAINQEDIRARARRIVSSYKKAFLVTTNYTKNGATINHSTYLYLITQGQVNAPFLMSEIEKQARLKPVRAITTLGAQALAHTEISSIDPHVGDALIESVKSADWVVTIMSTHENEVMAITLDKNAYLSQSSIIDAMYELILEQNDQKLFNRLHNQLKTESYAFREQILRAFLMKDTVRAGKPLGPLPKPVTVVEALGRSENGENRLIMFVTLRPFISDTAIYSWWAAHEGKPYSIVSGKLVSNISIRTRTTDPEAVANLLESAPVYVIDPCDNNSTILKDAIDENKKTLTNIEIDSVMGSIDKLSPSSSQKLRRFLVNSYTQPPVETDED